MTDPADRRPPVEGRPIAVVAPLRDEAESLAELVRQLLDVAQREGYALDVVLVDDGSTDGSWGAIQALAATHPEVRGLRFRRNFGKAAALTAGIAATSAPVVVTIDADLQDDPAEIPKLLAALDGVGPYGQGSLGQGFEVVSGWKVDRRDPWHKRWPSLVFNALASWLTGVELHDHNCGLKAYRREALEEVRLYGELHRFVPVLAAARGFRVGEVAVHHRPRVHGVSKYGVSRLAKGLLDLVTVKFLTSYGDRPQHLIGGFGLASFGVGGLVLAYLAVRWVVSRAAPGLEPLHVHETASLYYAIALCLVGAQFLAVGLLGAMLRASHPVEPPRYSIAERVGGPQSLKDGTANNANLRE